MFKTLPMTGLLIAIGASACASPSDHMGGDESGLEPAPVLTWEEYFAQAVPALGGGFQVEGDLWFPTEDAVYDYYLEITDGLVQKAHVFTQPIGGTSPDPKMFWPASKAVNIRYCLSATFSNLTTVRQAVNEAVRDWEAVANVDFKEVTVASCTPAAAAIDIAIMPMDPSGGYLGCAYPPIQNWQTSVTPLPLMFSPTGPNAACNNPKHLGLSQAATAGLVRHELGHALGFRHEHPWAAMSCGTEMPTHRWSDNFMAGSYYGGAALGPDLDTASVMFYSTCPGATSNGKLSAGDGISARRLYGLPVSWYVASDVI